MCPLQRAELTRRPASASTLILRGDVPRGRCCQNNRLLRPRRTAMREETKIVHSGRHPERFQGAVNPPVFHASTILSESVDEYRRKRKDCCGTCPSRITAAAARRPPR